MSSISFPHKVGNPHDCTTSFESQKESAYKNYGLSVNFNKNIIPSHFHSTYSTITNWNHTSNSLWLTFHRFFSLQKMMKFAMERTTIYSPLKALKSISLFLLKIEKEGPWCLYRIQYANPILSGLRIGAFTRVNKKGPILLWAKKWLNKMLVHIINITISHLDNITFYHYINTNKHFKT